MDADVRKEIGKRVLLGLFLLGIFLWLWPNLVHEPLHLLALKVQGSSGFITFDWGFPAQPTTTRTAEVSGVSGGMLYLLLPSVISLILLCICWKTRRNAGFITHIVLPTYLTFDLVINILHRALPTSDFRFLTVMPGWIATASVAIIAAAGMTVVLTGIKKTIPQMTSYYSSG